MEKYKGNTFSYSYPSDWITSVIIANILVLKQDCNPEVVNNFVARVDKGFKIPGILML